MPEAEADDPFAYAAALGLTVKAGDGGSISAIMVSSSASIACVALAKVVGEGSATSVSAGLGTTSASLSRGATTFGSSGAGPHDSIIRAMLASFAMLIASKELHTADC